MCLQPGREISNAMQDLKDFDCACATLKDVLQSDIWFYSKNRKIIMEQICPLPFVPQLFFWKKKVATEEEKFPQLLAGSTHEHAGAVRLQDMSPASDPPSERRPSLWKLPQQMERWMVVRCHAHTNTGLLTHSQTSRWYAFAHKACIVQVCM